MTAFLERLRDAVLQAASTIQYDAADLPARQLEVEVLPGPFSKKQQLQTRFDGGTEIDGETMRPNLEVTPHEPQGHVVRERALAEAQQSTERDSYRLIPLTGCHQSMLPGYRSNAAFGKIQEFELGETGLCKATELAHRWRNPRLSLLDGPWDLADDGEVLGVLRGTFPRATPDELEKDAKEWSLSYAPHARSQQVQNNMHACQNTCTKYADPSEKAAKQANKPQPSVCRFLSFTIFIFKVDEGVVENTKTTLRRGRKLEPAAYIAHTNERN